MIYVNGFIFLASGVWVDRYLQGSVDWLFKIEELFKESFSLIITTPSSFLSILEHLEPRILTIELNSPRHCKKALACDSNCPSISHHYYIRAAERLKEVTASGGFDTAGYGEGVGVERGVGGMGMEGEGEG